jgi:RNA polymerase sigma factor (sigma-70 family)
VHTDCSDPVRTADELLALRCQLGDGSAFDALVDRFHTAVWRYVRRVAGSEESADELSQEVWLEVVRTIGRLREPARLRAWIFSIAHRRLMNRLRVKYAQPPVAPLDDVPAPEAEPESRELDLERLDAALPRLPVIEREVVTLFYFRELSLAEVADALSVPVGTVKSRLFRARRLLRDDLSHAL